jgi:fibronectin-binding autotransporter adhesin
LGGGTLDFNGKSQSGTTLTVNTSGSVLANTSSAASVYLPTAVTLNAALTVNTTGNLTIGGPISGVGSLAKTGAGSLLLSNANLYSGATTISAGALKLIGSGSINNTSSITLGGGRTLLQNSSVALNCPINLGGGTFGGTGTYTGNLNVVSGHLSPGDGGLGALTVNGDIDLSATSTLDFDFGSTIGSCDLIQVSGTLDLDGVLNMHGSHFVRGGTYTIFSGASHITDSGMTFSNVPAGETIGYQISGGSVIVSVVPEPGSLLLLVMAGLSVLGYAWRKS